MCMYIKVAGFFVFFTNRITLIYLGQSLLVLLFSLVGFNGTVNTIRSFWCQGCCVYRQMSCQGVARLNLLSSLIVKHNRGTQEKNRTVRVTNT